MLCGRHAVGISNTKPEWKFGRVVSFLPQFPCLLIIGCARPPTRLSSRSRSCYPPLTPSPSRSITHGHAHPGRPHIRPRRRPVLHGECYCLLFHVCSIFGCAPLVPTHAHAPDHPPSLPSPSPSRACARIRPHSRSPLQGGSPPIKTMTTAGRLRHFPARLRSLLLTLFPEGRGASAVSPVDDD